MLDDAEDSFGDLNGNGFGDTIVVTIDGEASEVEMLVLAEFEFKLVEGLVKLLDDDEFSVDVAILMILVKKTKTN